MMKKIRRKSSNTDVKKRQATSTNLPPPPPPPVPSPPQIQALPSVPPLYARFARKDEGDGERKGSRFVVGAPMALGRPSANELDTNGEFMRSRASVRSNGTDEARGRLNGTGNPATNMRLQNGAKASDMSLRTMNTVDARRDKPLPPPIPSRSRSPSPQSRSIPPQPTPSQPIPPPTPRKTYPSPAMSSPVSPQPSRAQMRSNYIVDAASTSQSFSSPSPTSRAQTRSRPRDVQTSPSIPNVQTTTSPAGAGAATSNRSSRLPTPPSPTLPNIPPYSSSGIPRSSLSSSSPPKPLITTVFSTSPSKSAYPASPLPPAKSSSAFPPHRSVSSPPKSGHTQIQAYTNGNGQNGNGWKDDGPHGLKHKQRQQFYEDQSVNGYENHPTGRNHADVTNATSLHQPSIPSFVSKQIPPEPEIPPPPPPPSSQQPVSVSPVEHHNFAEYAYVLDLPEFPSDSLPSPPANGDGQSSSENGGANKGKEKEKFSDNEVTSLRSSHRPPSHTKSASKSRIPKSGLSSSRPVPLFTSSTTTPPRSSSESERRLKDKDGGSLFHFDDFQLNLGSTASVNGNGHPRSNADPPRKSGKSRYLTEADSAAARERVKEQQRIERMNADAAAAALSPATPPTSSDHQTNGNANYSSSRPGSSSHRTNGNDLAPPSSNEGNLLSSGISYSDVELSQRVGGPGEDGVAYGRRSAPPERNDPDAHTSSPSPGPSPQQPQFDQRSPPTRSKSKADISVRRLPQPPQQLLPPAEIVSPTRHVSGRKLPRLPSKSSTPTRQGSDGPKRRGSSDIQDEVTQKQSQGPVRGKPLIFAARVAVPDSGEVPDAVGEEWGHAEESFEKSTAEGRVEREVANGYGHEEMDRNESDELDGRGEGKVSYGYGYPSPPMESSPIPREEGAIERSRSNLGVNGSGEGFGPESVAASPMRELPSPEDSEESREHPFPSTPDEGGNHPDFSSSFHDYGESPPHNGVDPSSGPKKYSLPLTGNNRDVPDGPHGTAHYPTVPHPTGSVRKLHKSMPSRGSDASTTPPPFLSSPPTEGHHEAAHPQAEPQPPVPAPRQRRKSLVETISAVLSPRKHKLHKSQRSAQQAQLQAQIDDAQAHSRTMSSSTKKMSTDEDRPRTPLSRPPSTQKPEVNMADWVYPNRKPEEQPTMYYDSGPPAVRHVSRPPSIQQRDPEDEEYLTNAAGPEPMEDEPSHANFAGAMGDEGTEAMAATEEHGHAAEDEHLADELDEDDDQADDREDERPKTPLRSQPPSPPTSPEEYAHARHHRRGRKLSKALSSAVSEAIYSMPQDDALFAPARVPYTPPNTPEPPAYYPLTSHIAEPTLFGELLAHLGFYDWCILAGVSKEIRGMIYQEKALREEVLERYLNTVGYWRWSWEENEPLELSIQDLHFYMQGVSMPTHQYSHMAVMFMNSPQSYPDVIPTLTACTRAYTRVVLRLRAQAEAEERSFRVMAATSSVSVNKPNSSNGAVPSSFKLHPRSVSQPRGAMFSRPPSRAASPSSSAGHGIPSNNLSPRGPPRSRTSSNPSAPNPSESLTWNFPTFRSPLFRPRRAPLLQVFVPSPEGEWLSDASVLRCEAELKNAGVLKLLRRGDVIWDTAVGDEGNVGRMVWDGSYLIDLDYTYSRTGEIPQYLHSLAFPPSYFHRVIRTPANPICYVNIAPWSEEVASNLQLLQDRVRAETPQGGHHTVVRWVHRSSFVIRPPSSSSPTSPRIPIPGTSLVIDPGWYGTVVIEAEGTNEGLADLQNRCKGAFPPRAGSQKREGSRVFKILREKSRPAEIWLRTVGERERLM